MARTRKKTTTPVVEETPVEIHASAEIADQTKEFDKFLPHIKAGIQVTLESEPGVYFEYGENRLKKYSDNGGYIDAYPLYAFQNRTGWAIRFKL